MNDHFPKTIEEIVLLFKTYPRPHSFVIVAGNRSFGKQCFLPESLPLRYRHRIHLSKLEQKATLCEENFEDSQYNIQRWDVTGSMTWESFLRKVRDSNSEFNAIPFCCPTSHWITIGGYLVSNGHSRMTTVGCGLMKDTVECFDLLTVSGELIHCSPIGNEIERQLYDGVPGSFGSLGIVTNARIILRKVKCGTTLFMKTVECGNSIQVVRKFRKLSEENLEYSDINLLNGKVTVKDKYHAYWDQGLAVMLYGHPAKGNGVIVGHRLSSPEECKKVPSIALCDGQDDRNAMIQGLAHRFTYFATLLQKLTFKPNSIFKADIYHWLFFQNGHDWAKNNFLPKWWCSRLLCINTDLPVVHQTWIVPVNYMELFLETIGKLLEEKGLVNCIEFQDILYMPPNSSHYCLGPGPWYTYTLSVAVHSDKIGKLAIDCFVEITKKTLTFGSKTYLLKANFSSDLMNIHSKCCREKLFKLKNVVDPFHRLKSSMMDGWFQ